MNKVIRKVVNGIESYQLTTDSGKTFDCVLWFEKKTGATHVKLPKDNESGRIYIRKSIVDSRPEGYKFETKTEHRTGIIGGGWRTKMTPEEAIKVQKAEETLREIREACVARDVVKVDPNSIEGIELQMARLLARKARLEADRQ